MTSPELRDNSGYYTIGEERVPGFSTIKNAGLPMPALPRWAAKSVAEYVADKHADIIPLLSKDRDAAVKLLKGAPWAARDDAAERGSAVHQYIEDDLLGVHGSKTRAIEAHPSTAGYVRAYRTFMNEWKPDFEASELTVFSRSHQYAGTLDFIATLPGLGKVIGDFKTGNGVYEDVALQLAAYRYAEYAVVGKDLHEMPKVDTAVVVHIRPDRYEVREVRADRVAYQAFLDVYAVSDWCRTGCKNVIGKSLKPGAVA